MPKKFYVDIKILYGILYNLYSLVLPRQRVCRAGELQILGQHQILFGILYNLYSLVLPRQSVCRAGEHYFQGDIKFCLAFYIIYIRWYYPGRGCAGLVNTKFYVDIKFCLAFYKMLLYKCVIFAQKSEQVVLLTQIEHTAGVSLFGLYLKCRAKTKAYVAIHHLKAL